VEVEGKSAEAPSHDVRNSTSVCVAQQNERPAESLGLRNKVSLFAHADGGRTSSDDGGVDADYGDTAPVQRAVTRHDSVARYGLSAPKFGEGERPDFVPRSRFN
jgi:hypothetical protein